MREELIYQIDLICPRCRRAGVNGIVQSTLRLDRVFGRDDDSILEGFLVCSNADCRCVYPILEGVPVILRDMVGWWRSEGARLSRVNSTAPEIREYFEALGNPSYYTERALIGSYMDLHYGGLRDAPVVPDSWADPEAFWETVVGMARPETQRKYERSLDFGCSVGRYTFELARFSHLVVGVDLNFKAVSAAAGLQRNGKLCYYRRKHGRRFEEVQISYSPRKNVAFIVADSLDPPFGAGSFDLVTGLNLLDNVKLPLVLMGQMDALLRRDGILMVCSPYEWREDVCEQTEWLETDDLDAPEMVRNILKGELFPEMGLKYQILQEVSDFPWVMRHHARYWSLFLVHLIKARNVGSPTTRTRRREVVSNETVYSEKPKKVNES